MVCLPGISEKSNPLFRSFFIPSATGKRNSFQEDHKIEDTSQKLPFIHNNIFMNEYQGTKQRASLLGEEENLEVCNYAESEYYHPNAKLDEAVFESTHWNNMTNTCLQKSHIDDRLIMNKSTVSTGSDHHQADQIKGKIIRFKKEQGSNGFMFEK